MGGIGSGRIRTLSDEDRKKRGTFREGTSEEAALARAAEKIVAGPWLASIPEPTLPLNDVGRQTFDKYSRLLFDQNKLTAVTCELCEALGVMKQQIHARMSAGKSVSADIIKRYEAVLSKLRVAENAPTIASPGGRNRFEGSGFSNSRSSPVRLRPYRPSGSGEL